VWWVKFGPDICLLLLLCRRGKGWEIGGGVWREEEEKTGEADLFGDDAGLHAARELYGDREYGVAAFR
jgi:hypothetical protein